MPIAQIMQDHLHLRILIRAGHDRGEIAFDFAQQVISFGSGGAASSGAPSSPISSSEPAVRPADRAISRAVSRPAFAEEPMRRSRIVFRNPAPGLRLRIKPAEVLRRLVRAVLKARLISSPSPSQQMTGQAVLRPWMGDDADPLQQPALFEHRAGPTDDAADDRIMLLGQGRKVGLEVRPDVSAQVVDIAGRPLPATAAARHRECRGKPRARQRAAAGCGTNPSGWCPLSATAARG